MAGSFLLRSLAKPSLNVDLALRMPSECLVPRDSLNHRYLDKRALYAGQLATAAMNAEGRLGKLVDKVEVSALRCCGVWGKNTFFFLASPLCVCFQIFPVRQLKKDENSPYEYHHPTIPHSAITATSEQSNATVSSTLPPPATPALLFYKHWTFGTEPFCSAGAFANQSTNRCSVYDIDI